MWEDAGEDGGKDLAASPATHHLRPAFRIGMMSGGDKMKEPTFRIPVRNSTWSHAVGVPTYLGEKKIVIFERVNFIRPAGEMDSTGVALGNSPDKVSPGIHQNNG